MDLPPTFSRPGGAAPAVWCGAPPPDDEGQRLFFLRSTGLLDTTASAAFDRITRLASQIFEVPISLISLVDEQRQWFKSRVGLDVDETPREVSFCAYCVSDRAPLVVPDARQDARFAGNLLVTGAPGIRFYAGAPLVLPTGHVLGSLCIIDTRPRAFSAAQLQLLQDLAALVMSQIDLHQLAGRVHEVTRLPNRAQLADDLRAACRDARAGGQCTLMLLDLMGNDQLHSAVRAIGIARLESALRSVASQLLGWLPAGAALYHVSESRLAVLLVHAGAHAPQDDFASGLLARFDQPLWLNGLSVQLHVDAGLARFRLLPGEAEDALRRASTALHGARAAQQRLAWHQPADDAPHQRAYALLHSIPAALAAGEFRLVYQPKLNLRSGRFSGVEALARWRSAQHGDVSPAEFVALIESTALIHEFTEWVLHQALAQLAAWRAQGLELTMAVNVSARNLEHPHFLRMLRNACALHDVPAPALHLECTENAVIAGTRTARVLQEVLALGVSISLDDFGVGYSNLACLHSLPVQLLKLDQSLIKPIAADVRALALVRSLILMGHSLGYRLLAEGVESAEVLDILAREGCDAAQGYHLSRPLEASAAADFLRAAPAVAALAAPVSAS
ncbi:sensor domain-containing phosphodiesterase [Oryzisolibacter propanilivorax]|nr:sensor domain-containing phosphodiesterase [Oryzisolibacter propanilivorax]